jgi:hypothetical protein
MEKITKDFAEKVIEKFKENHNLEERSILTTQAKVVMEVLAIAINLHEEEKSQNSPHSDSTL